MVETLVPCAPAALEGEGHAPHYRVALRGHSRGHTAGQCLRPGVQSASSVTRANGRRVGSRQWHGQRAYSRGGAHDAADAAHRD